MSEIFVTDQEASKEESIFGIKAARFSGMEVSFDIFNVHLVIELRRVVLGR